MAARWPVADATADQPRSQTVPIAHAAIPATTGHAATTSERCMAWTGCALTAMSARRRNSDDGEDDAGDAGAERGAGEQERRDRIVAAVARPARRSSGRRVVPDRHTVAHPLAAGVAHEGCDPVAVVGAVTEVEGEHEAVVDLDPFHRAVVVRQSIVDWWRQSMAPMPARVSPVTVSGTAIARSATTASTGRTRSGSRAVAQSAR